MVGTKDIKPYEMYLDGELVHLIDTPGFDDTYQSDADILGLLAQWLFANYLEGVLITGVILLHPVSANRIYGSEWSRLRLFEDICGADAWSRTVIATTMWDEISSYESGSARVQERMSSPECWGEMVAGGANVVRHDNNGTSARRIVSMLCGGESKPVPLLIQKELESNDVSLAETSAGNRILSDLEERCKWLEEEQDRLQKEQKGKDQKITELNKEKECLDLELEKFQQQKKKLVTSKVSSSRQIVALRLLLISLNIMFNHH